MIGVAGAGCTDPSGFCGLAGRSCALPSGGGLGSVPSVPYYTGSDGLEACMAKCTSDTKPKPALGAAVLGPKQQACSCFEWSGDATPSCLLHDMVTRSQMIT